MKCIVAAPTAGSCGVLPAVQLPYQARMGLEDEAMVRAMYVAGAIGQALPLLDGKLKGFAAPDAVLTAPETRSSSPVRILRDDTRQSVLRGLYPTGEGAGYAGGIMSAAIDGMMTAEAVLGGAYGRKTDR